MLTPDQQLELEVDIVSWLDTVPSDTEILEYAARMPDEDASALVSAGESYLRILFQRKDNYFAAANCEDLVEDVPVPEQIEAMGNFSRYSAASVISSLGKKYPSVAQLILPPHMAEWGQGFLDRMEAGVALVSARDHLEARLYLGSLQKLHDATMLSALQAELHSLFLKEGEAHDAGRPLAQADSDAWLAFYRRLKFLPDDRAVQLSRVEGFLERLKINVALIDCFAILTSPGSATNLEDALWHIERARVLKAIVDLHESERRARSPQGKEAVEVYRKLNQIWTEENILNGQSVQQTLALVAQAQNSYLPIDLTSFFKDSLMVEGALDPLDAATVVENIAKAMNDAEAEVYVTQLITSDGWEEEQRTLLRALLHQIMQLVRGIRPIQAQASSAPTQLP